MQINLATFALSDSASLSRFIAGSLQVTSVALFHEEKRIFDSAHSPRRDEAS